MVQGEGGVEVTAPLPLGPGVDLGVSLRIGGDADEPPLALYVGPAEDAPVGVLMFGRLTVEPAPDHRDHKHDEHEPQAHPDGQPYSGVIKVSVDLPPMLPVADHATTHKEREASTAAAPPADEPLSAELWDARQTLLNEGVDPVFGYDPKTRRAVLVHVSDESRPQRQVFIGLDAFGHLSISVTDATYGSPEVG